MRQMALLFSSLFICAALAAQVTLQLQLPPAGITVKSQLWNFSLINTGTGNVNVRVDMTVTDQSVARRVFTGTSKTFIIPKGFKQVQATDVVPVQYTINSSNYGIDASPDGFLPVGVFSVCFTVTELNNDASSVVAEDCETIEVEALSPPMLLTPSDNEKVEMTRPLFTWVPPMPMQLFNRLLYDYLLVEVQRTQTGAVAIQQNFPVYSQKSITGTSLQYPLSGPELDSNKLYAWQVTARNNNSSIAQTEIWTFRIATAAADTANRPSSSFYVKLVNSNEAAYAVCSGVVHYAYINEANDSIAAIKLYDLTAIHAGSTAIEMEPVPLKFGENFKALDLTEVAGVIDKHLYLLELQNSKNEKWFMKFEYRGAENK